MTEQSFREQTIANLATLTEAVDNLKEAVSAMATAVRDDDLAGRKCRAEVDSSITSVRVDLERKIAALGNRAAYVAGATGVAGVAVGAIVTILVKG
jgi:hypothetical protein